MLRSSRESRKTKLQGSDTQNTKTLQSGNSLQPKSRFRFSRLNLLHGRLTKQCLDRRIPDKQTLIDETAAWQHHRNTSRTKADWQFTTRNARIKLKHLYPSI